MNVLYELSGLLGSVCFAVATWPQAYYAFRHKSAKGVSLLYGSLLFMGGFCSSAYALLTAQYVILPNFLCGLAGISVVMYYKLKEVRNG